MRTDRSLRGPRYGQDAARWRRPPPGPDFSHPLFVMRALCLALAVGIVVLLFHAGAHPAAAGLIPAPWDKLAHAAVYSAFTALLWLGTAGRRPLTVIAIVVAVAALDELYQATLPGRTADIVDFLVDICAAAITIALISLQSPAPLDRRTAPRLPR